jgi:hypothetical protein
MAEFFSAWHADAFIEATKREIEASERRIVTLGGSDGAERAIAECEAAIKLAKADLKRVEKLAPALHKAEKAAAAGEAELEGDESEDEPEDEPEAEAKAEEHEEPKE